MRPLLVRLGSLLGLSLAGLILSSSVAIAQTPGPDLQAQALALLKGAPHQVGVAPGEVLYIREKNYDRYGPKAEDIAKVRNITTEKNVRETWYEIGSDRKVVRSASRVIDANGDVVQVDLGGAGRAQAIDPRTGEVLADGDNAAWPIDDFTLMANAYANLVAQGSMDVVSVSDDQVVLEAESDFAKSKNNDWQKPGNFVVPFYQDLDAGHLLVRHTIGSDGLESQSEMYAVTSAGQQVLISSSTTTDLEVVKAIPDDLLSVAAEPDQPSKAGVEPLSAKYCYNTLDCIDSHTYNPGVLLTDFAQNHLFAIGSTGGIWSYHGDAYSEAASAINSISVTGTGGHYCSGNYHLNTWYQSDSHSNATYASVGADVNQSSRGCVDNWRSWTDGSHNMVDDLFGWSPTTHAEIDCGGTLYC